MQTALLVAALANGIGVDALCAALTELQLAEQNVSDAGAASLADALAHNTSLTNIDLTKNKIGAAGAACLAEAMACNTLVVEFELADNPTGDAGQPFSQRIRTACYVCILRLTFFIPYIFSQLVCLH